MKSSILLAIACVALTGAAQAQLYKCTSPGGGVTYSDLPCAGSAERLNVRNDRPDAASVARSEERERVEIAISKRQVMVGMREADVVRSWGRPHRVNRTVSGSGSREQWIYERGRIGASQYVHLTNGVVTSIHSPD